MDVRVIIDGSLLVVHTHHCEYSRPLFTILPFWGEKHVFILLLRIVLDLHNYSNLFVANLNCDVIVEMRSYRI